MVDTCFHRKVSFHLLHHVGHGFFHVNDLGFTPVCIITGKEHGYVLHCSILEEELYLTSIHIDFWPEAALHVKIGEAPIIYGVPPSSEEFGAFLFDGIKVPLALTGAIILGDEIIEDEHSQRSWLPMWDYKYVRELLFEDGKLTDDFDRSKEVAALRSKLINNGHPVQISDIKSLRKLERWTNKCFSNEYREHLKTGFL